MIKNVLTLCLITMFLISCKGQEKEKNITLEKKEKAIKILDRDSIREIYIGKHFFAGDELNYYLSTESKDFIEVDSLSYSIYQRKYTHDYIFCLEKFLKDDDVAKFEIIDTINLKNHNSADFGVKEVLIDRHVNIIFYLKDKQIKTWKYNRKKTNQTLIDEKWYGIYNTTIDENNKDWRASQDISISILKDSIIFEVAGYQIFQKYKLRGFVDNNKLKLVYANLIDGSESAVLEKTKDFGKISYDGKKYYWVSPYIDKSFTNGKSEVHTLNKN